MRCPFCSHSEDRVLDTRESRDGTSIRRRRECLECKSRFSTTETMSLVFPFIVKKDGRREPFSREKVLKGIQAACQKRPVSAAEVESIVDRISSWIIYRGEKEASSQLVGQKVMRELRALDDVAYVRFASVYRNFHDVQEFVETLEDEDNYDIVEGIGQLTLAPEKALNASIEKPNNESAGKTPGPGTRPADTLPS